MKHTPVQKMAFAGLLTLLAFWWVWNQRNSSAPTINRPATHQPVLTAPRLSTNVNSQSFPTADTPLTVDEPIGHESSAPDVQDFCPEYAALSADSNTTAELNAAALLMFNTARDSLGKSTLPEHLSIAALLSQDNNERIALVGQAIAQDPRNPFHYWIGITTCHRKPAPIDCPNPQWEEALLELDHQNSASWMAVAASRYSRGDRHGALEGIRQAGAAAQSTVFWTDTIRRAETALNAAGVGSSLMRSSLAIGLSATVSPGYFRYTNMCRTESTNSPEWAQACALYGQQASRRSDTLLNSSIALAIQSQALNALGETDKAKHVEDQRTQLRKESYQTIGKIGPALELLSVGVPDLFHYYLDMLDTHGELQATRMKNERVIAFAQERSEESCALLVELYKSIY